MILTTYHSQKPSDIIDSVVDDKPTRVPTAVVCDVVATVSGLDILAVLPTKQGVHHRVDSIFDEVTSAAGSGRIAERCIFLLQRMRLVVMIVLPAAQR